MGILETDRQPVRIACDCGESFTVSVIRVINFATDPILLDTDANINISFMHLGRLKPRGQALMILALDESLSGEQQKKILALSGVDTVKLVKL